MHQGSAVSEITALTLPILMRRRDVRLQPVANKKIYIADISNAT